ncbi:MAG: tetratricopeptide repeat protein [Candidatus Acidiferrales bacterium]
MLRGKSIERKRSGALVGALLACAILSAALAWAGPSGQLAKSGPAPEVISIEASPQLFATMCVLEAAGFGANASNGDEVTDIAALQADLLQMNGPAFDSVRAYYKEHELSAPGETLSRYISFALVVGPPPKFSYQLNQFELPPDVLALQNFDDVMRDFYVAAHIEDRWRDYQTSYAAGVREYELPVRKMVYVATAYLREILKPEEGRTFRVYYEPLVGGRTNFRSYGERYAIVVGTKPEASMDDVQHAFLHFMLDPLALRYQTLVESKKALLGDAGRAANLPVEYQRDFIAFFTECMVKAAELRLKNLRAADAEKELSADDRNGLVLVRPLVAQLLKFEKAGPAMEYYYGDVVKGIDVAAEHQRLQSVQFAKAGEGGNEPGPTEQRNLRAPKPQVTELDGMLALGDHQIATQDGAGAEATFARALEKYPNEPRAMYGLAVALVIETQVERAQALFEKIVTPGGAGAATKDPAILSWSHIYLGRIHDLEGERELAVNEYQAALEVQGAPESAVAAARRGIASGAKPAAKEN